MFRVTFFYGRLREVRSGFRFPNSKAGSGFDPGTMAAFACDGLVLQNVLTALKEPFENFRRRITRHGRYAIRELDWEQSTLKFVANQARDCS